MAKREFMSHRDTITKIKDGKFVSEPRERIVRVLARAEGWAMVRPTGLATYCCYEKELFPISGAQEGERHDDA